MAPVEILMGITATVTQVAGTVMAGRRLGPRAERAV